VNEQSTTPSGLGGTSDLERAATAYHEAAHAVAAHLLGRGVTRVTIVPFGDAAGGVLLRERSSSFARMPLAVTRS
jgi:ATP-dependent Zn protease